MMSAFLLRELVSSDIAWAIARSSSRSLRSSTDRSSCCSAAISHLARLRPRYGSVSPDAKGHGTKGKDARRIWRQAPATPTKSPSEYRLGESGFDCLSPAMPTAYWRAAVSTSYRTRGLVSNNPTGARVVPAGRRVGTPTRAHGKALLEPDGGEHGRESRSTEVGTEIWLIAGRGPSARGR